MTVLIVDDNDTNRKLCAAILRGRVYQVRDAADGERALAAVQRKLPQLILMDVQMPVLDGVQALKRLKADPATSNIPVVALTSYAMKGDREKYLREGFSEYLSKPIDIDRFLETVRRLAPLRPPTPQGPAAD